MRKSTHNMCKTWAKDVHKLWAVVVDNIASKMRMFTTTYLYQGYALAIHPTIHIKKLAFLPVKHDIIPTFHSTYKELETCTLNNTNTRMCGEPS
jgi:hypothetical protein